MKIIAHLVMLLVWGVMSSMGQSIPEKGVPLLENIEPLEYKHMGKIWSISSAPNGMAYFAADKGLLEYDGISWKNYKGSEGIIRSIIAVNDSLLYSGSDVDFGLWQRNAHFEMVYTSLYPFKEELMNEEFWGVHPIKDNVFFVSANNIYVYRNQSLTKVPAPARIKSSFTVDNILYLTDEQSGLYQFTDLTPKQVLSYNGMNDMEIRGLFSINGKLTLVSRTNGLWQEQDGRLVSVFPELSRQLKQANVFSVERIGESYLAFGTILNGLLITDTSGRIIHVINKGKGLQNNTILSLHFGNTGRLWMGMDYGISSLNLEHPFTFFYDFKGEFGTGYSAVVHQNTFYLGTNQGLYHIQWDDLNNTKALMPFSLVKGTEGQVWDVVTIDNDVWIGHDKGLFRLKNKQLESMGVQDGIWTILPIEDRLLVGTYNGIHILKKEGTRWVYHAKMNQIVGSCNQLLLEGTRTLWITIPTFGIIRAQLDDNLQPIERQIFESKQFESREFSLLHEGQHITVHSNAKKYRYHPSTGTFELASEVPFISTEPVFLPGLLPVSQLTDAYDFYPVYNGFALRSIHSGLPHTHRVHTVVFRHLEAFDNVGSVTISHGTTLPSRYANVRISAVVPNHHPVMYQHRINGGAWSAWTSNHTTEHIGLSSGTYHLEVQAMVMDTLSPVSSFTFIILAPWYASWYAYLVYVGVALLMIYGLYTWQMRSLHHQEQQLLSFQQQKLQEQEERHRLQLQKIQQERLQEEFDEVKTQLKHKTVELANKAKESEAQQRLLSTLKEKFEQLQLHPESVKSRSLEIQRLLESQLQLTDNAFEIQMDELHQEFFKKMKQRFPGLSSHDLRLCAYVKIGFNSKEIADLLNIQPSSVYISRSRLRKKLNLESDGDLYGYLNGI